MPNLPDLTPEMLLSYGGMREFEGAQALRHESHTAQALREMAEHQPEVFNPGVAETADDDFQISFDHGDDWVDAESTFRTPARGERFSVLRPPQREPFRPPPPIPGPQGGPMREVGRVGRFAILAEEPARDFLAEARARLEDRIVERQFENPARSPRTPTTMTTAQVRTQRQVEHRAAVHETLPTAYDRLMNEDDPFEDDLE